MNKYQSLSNICDDLIDKGWKPRGNTYFGTSTRMSHWLGGLAFITDEENRTGHIKSIHEIFGKESGFMESANRQNRNEKLRYREQAIRGLQYHYMVMGPMTVEEKIDYVLENIEIT